MNDPTAETWRPVVGHEGIYEVSDQGRVRSLDRTARRGGGYLRTVRGRIMRLTPGMRGGKYLVVGLHDGHNQARTHTVHSLVAAAFLGPRPEGLEVCHWNGDGHDNRLENLRYDTRSANQDDKIRHMGGLPPACPSGHLYDAANTYVRANGKSRTCRTCRRDGMARARRSQAEEMAHAH